MTLDTKTPELHELIEKLNAEGTPLALAAADTLELLAVNCLVGLLQDMHRRVKEGDLRAKLELQLIVVAFGPELKRAMIRLPDPKESEIRAQTFAVLGEKNVMKVLKEVRG